VTSAKRLKQLPDVQTVTESVPGFEGYLWMGLMAPAGTPQPVLDKLVAAARRAVERADIQARFDKDGVEPVGGTPAAFKALVTREIAQWRDLAKQADIKVE